MFVIATFISESMRRIELIANYANEPSQNLRVISVSLGRDILNCFLLGAVCAAIMVGVFLFAGRGR